MQRASQSARRRTTSGRVAPPAALSTIAALALGAAACADADNGAVTSAIEATTSATNEGVFVVASTEMAMASPTPAAAAVAARLAFRAWFPRCADVATVDVADPGLVVVHFVNCAGFQWARLAGTLTLHFDAVPAGLQVHVQTDQLRINGGVLSTDATLIRSESTDTPPVVTLTGTSQSSFTGARGVTVVRAGTYALTWQTDGSQCLGLDGHWTLDTNGEQIATDVSGYRRCGTHCPQAGGQIELVRGNGAHIRVSYPGGATAEWASSVADDGGALHTTRGGVVDLACTP